MKHPPPAAEPNPDGSTTVYFDRAEPEEFKRGYWIQTMPGKGWFMLLRLYSPRNPLFTKEWRLSDLVCERPA